MMPRGIVQGLSLNLVAYADHSHFFFVQKDVCGDLSEYLGRRWIVYIVITQLGNPGLFL